MPNFGASSRGWQCPRLLFLFTTAFISSALGHLSVHPPVLFLDEDWPLGRPLNVQICRTTAEASRREPAVENDPLELRILSVRSGEGEASQGDEADEGPFFALLAHNESCAGLALNRRLDADAAVPFPSDAPLAAVHDSGFQQHKTSKSWPSSFSLLLEELDSRATAVLQIELVDVNDNAPRFLGGPFPVQLVIPADSPPGYLLRRLEVFDPDRGIGGISRFSLDSLSLVVGNNGGGEQKLASASSNQTADGTTASKEDGRFALEAAQCHWPRCSVELRLRHRMADGERAELRVRARDGAGLVGGSRQRRRVNQAEAIVRVMAVGEQQQQQPVAPSELITEPQIESVDGEDGGNGSSILSATTNDSTGISSAGSTQKMPNTTASLVIFNKERRTFTTKNVVATTTKGSSSREEDDGWDSRNDQGRNATAAALEESPFEAANSFEEEFPSKNSIASTKTFTIPSSPSPPSSSTSLPPTSSLPTQSHSPTTFLIDSLSEDAPVGLELLRIPLPSAADSPAVGGVQFVQLDGSRSLWMSANGSVRLTTELDTANTPELAAEVRLGNTQLLAVIRAKIRPMLEQFRHWMDEAIPTSNTSIHLKQSDLALAVHGQPIPVLTLPDNLGKYARLELIEGANGQGGLELQGRQLLLMDRSVGEHCARLALEFRGVQRLARQICVTVPELVLPVEVHWPANNSRHFFPENQPFPVLLTFNSSGPPTLEHSIDAGFADGAAFSIGAHSGQLSLRQGPGIFDFEQQPVYQLAVLVCAKPTSAAADVATTASSSSDANANGECLRLLIWLEVLDANDHCPGWRMPAVEDQPMIIVELSEATAPNARKPVAQFGAAEDGDGSADQRSICYRLLVDDSNDGTFGLLVPDRPELYLLRALDREQISAYQLRVLAEDCAWVEQKCTSSADSGTGTSPANTTSTFSSSRLLLSISVRDVNDNAPRFLRRHFFAALLRPNVQPTEALLQLRAEDPDQGRLRFGWGEGMVQTEADPLPIAVSPFRLNRSSGELSLRDDFMPADLDGKKSFTFRVRVRDQPAPVHEDQATVTITVLDPEAHLLQLGFAEDGERLEAQLSQLERLLTSLVADLGWQLLVHRLDQCGAGNCTRVTVYLLDNKGHWPVDAAVALDALKRAAAGAGPKAAISELQTRFRLTAFELGVVAADGQLTDQQNGQQQMAVPASTVGSSATGRTNAPLALLRRLGSLTSPIGLAVAVVLVLLALACPFLCCRFLCRKFCAAAKAQKMATTFDDGGLNDDDHSSPPFGVRSLGGVRLLMAKDGSGLLGAAHMPAAPAGAAGRELRIRWQADSEDFEFPAPPPVRMYGAPGSTLSIPRAKHQQHQQPMGQSTEF